MTFINTGGKTAPLPRQCELKLGGGFSHSRGNQKYIVGEHSSHAPGNSQAPAVHFTLHGAALFGLRAIGSMRSQRSYDLEGYLAHSVRRSVSYTSYQEFTQRAERLVRITPWNSQRLLPPFDMLRVRSYLISIFTHCINSLVQ